MEGKTPVLKSYENMTFRSKSNEWIQQGVKGLYFSSSCHLIDKMILCRIDFVHRCVKATSKTDCLRMIRDDQVDIVGIDTDLGYVARQ